MRVSFVHGMHILRLLPGVSMALNSLLEWQTIRI